VLHLHNPIALETPGPNALELGTVLDEVANGLHDLVQAGLVRHAGFTGLGDTSALQEVIRSEDFQTVQTYFNVLNPSAGFAGHAGGQQDFDGLIGTAERSGVGVIVIRVLAAGAATADPQRPANAGDPGGNLVGGGSYATDLERAAAIQQLATELGLDGPVELAIRFGLSKPGVSTVLVGYSTLAHLEEAIRYADRGPLGDDVVTRVLELW
jgi:aryl-alcohol dehydrogenase-like predicted oxidoreductase